MDSQDDDSFVLGVNYEDDKPHIYEEDDTVDFIKIASYFQDCQEDGKFVGLKEGLNEASIMQV